MIGQTISHYRIVDEISRGGMGIVYRAVDVSLNREVALKILPADLVADPDRRARFLQEAQAASALEHPHIAVIHEVGEAGGVHFIAMELIRGEKLSDVLARGPLKVERALDLATEIAEALGRAHDKGIVHRDLKPANVMITEYGHSKVIDFGLAKLVEPIPSDLSRETGQIAQTDPGVMLGTVAYMAPEQARGTKVDQRADIFAFGILLYEMLAGQPPFRAQSGLDTLHAILNTPAPALPPLTSESAPDVQRIVNKCLEKDPDARYQGMKDLAVDLRAARRRSEPSGAASHATAVPVSSTSSRPRWVPWAALAGGVVIVGAIVGLVFSRRTPPPAAVDAPSSKPSVAVMYFENNTGNQQLEWLRTGLTDMIVTDLSQSPNIEVLGTDRLYQILSELKRQDDRQVSFDVVQEVANRAGIQNVLLGSYVKAGDVIRINLKLQEAKTGRIIASERVDAAGESNLLSMVDDLTRRIKERFDVRPAGGPAPLLARPTTAPATAPAVMDRELKDVTTQSIEAYRHYVEGIDLHNQLKEDQAVPLLERAAAIDPGFAMAYAKLAVIHGNQGNPAESIKYGKLALDHADRLTARERSYIEGVHYSRSRNTWPQAIEAYRRGLALFPEHLPSRNNLGLLYLRLERYPDAVEQYAEAVRRGMTFPSAHGSLALAHLALGNPDEAQRVVDAYVRAHPDTLSSAIMLGRLHLQLGRLDQSVAAFDRAKALGPIDWRVHSAMWEVHMLRRDWEQAAATARAMTGLRDSFSRWAGSMALANLALHQGRSAAALRELERALGAYSSPGEFTGATHVEMAHVLRQRRDVLRAASEADKAAADSVNTLSEAAAYEAQALTSDAAGRRDATEAALRRLRKLAELPFGDLDRRAMLLTEGELAMQRGRADAAIDPLTRAVALLPPRAVSAAGPPPHVPIWFALASALFATGRDDEAQKWFTRIVDAAGERTWYPVEYVRSFYFLGKLAEKRGDAAKVREHYSRFVEFWKDGDLDRERVVEASRALGSGSRQ